jgi:hypothetical protein
MRLLGPIALAGLCIAAAPASADPVSAAAAPPAESAAVAALPTLVPPTDSRIRYIGRFDWRDSAGPRCEWTGSEVELRFSGSDLNAVINDTGSDYFEVVVDGVAGAPLAVQKGEATYSVVAGAPRGNHIVEIFKRTEAFVGDAQFCGFQLAAGGKLLPLGPAPSRRLEVIGDSISCGYGNEGKDQNEHFTPATENGYLSYGAVAARRVGAEYTCIAWSGRTMWPTNSIPEVYDYTLPDDTTSRCDFTKWIPGAILINLSTNDWNKGAPDEASWTGAYENFIAHLRAFYPNAAIYCASSPMMSDDWPPNAKARSTSIAYLNRIVADENKAGDLKVRYLEFPAQDGAADGLGADWHPSVKTDAKMAAILDAALQKDLRWTVTDAAGGE